MSHSPAGPRTVQARFLAAAERFPERPFLNVLPETAAAYGIAAGETTYAEARARIEALRAAYAAAGWGGGHRVGLLLLNLFFGKSAGLPAALARAERARRLRRADQTRTCAPPSRNNMIGHSEMDLAVAVPARAA